MRKIMWDEIRFSKEINSIIKKICASMEHLILIDDAYHSNFVPNSNTLA